MWPERFLQAVEQAQNILYLADNAGEIAFDRLLIEQISPARVTLAVRGGPVINDVTRRRRPGSRTYRTGRSDRQRLRRPRHAARRCSPEFLRRFAAADLIIAKGQGNFETLANQRAIYSSYSRAKCPAGRPMRSNNHKERRY